MEQKFQHQKIVELLEVLLPMDVEQCVRIKALDPVVRKRIIHKWWGVSVWRGGGGSEPPPTPFPNLKKYLDPPINQLFGNFGLFFVVFLQFLARCGVSPPRPPRK